MTIRHVRVAVLCVMRDTNREKEDISLVSISPVKVGTSIVTDSNNVPTTTISVVKVDTNIVMVINREKVVISVAKVTSPVMDTNSVRAVISIVMDTNSVREATVNKTVTIVPAIAISSVPAVEPPMIITSPVRDTSIVMATVNPINVPLTGRNSGVPSVPALMETISSALTSVVLTTRK